MITEIFISYPWWTIALVILLGLTYAGLLYVGNPHNKLGRFVTIMLFFFRFSAVALLTFLLLSPYIRTKKKQVEKPIVIIGHDNSSSIIMGNDSTYYKNELISQLAGFKEELSAKADIESYTFGESVSQSVPINYGDNTSNYSDFISTLSSDYAGLNVGAVVIVGDGIVNNGIDAVYAASDLNIPIFTVALGDTSQFVDVKIDEVRTNSIVYTGDTFPLEVNVAATNLDGKTIWIRILENNRELESHRLNIVGDVYHGSYAFSLSATKPGKKRYTVIVDEVDSESVISNNSRDVFLDVLDSRLKILVLGAAPHPDIGAYKQSLDHNPNFDVTISYITSGIINFDAFDMIILYQVPSNLVSSKNKLDDIIASGLPILYVVGKQSRFSALNNYIVGLKLNSALGTMAMAQFDQNPKFSKFTFDKEMASQLSKLPPLSVPMANYIANEGLDILAYQKISEVVTDFPLIAYHSDLDSRNAVIMGEGLWMWRIQSYVEYGNTAAIDALLSKTVMFLTAENDKRRFKVISNGVYDSRSEITLVAELYNEALELDNSADVSLKLSNENNEVFNFLFSPFENYYTINLNKLPVGVYNYTASVKLSNDSFKDAGEFIVQNIDYESKDLNADHRMLSRLAENHGGEMYYPNQIQELTQRVLNLETLKSKIHYQDTFIGLNTIIYIMITIIALLSLEWFLRKYTGSY